MFRKIRIILKNKQKTRIQYNYLHIVFPEINMYNIIQEIYIFIIQEI